MENKQNEHNENKLKKRDYIYIALLAIIGILAICAFIFSFAPIDVKKLIYSEDHLLTIIGIIVSTVGVVLTVYFVVLAFSARKIQLEIYGIKKDFNDIDNQKGIIQIGYAELESTKNKIQSQYETLESEKKSIQSQYETLESEKKSIQSEYETLVKEKMNIQSEFEALEKENTDIQSCLKDLKLQLKFMQTQNIFYEDFAQSMLDGLESQMELAIFSKDSLKLRELLIKRARLSYKYPILNVKERIRLLLELGNIGEEQDIIPVQNIIKDEDEQGTIKAVAIDVSKALNERFGISKIQ